MSTDHPTTIAPVEYREIPGVPGYRVGDDGSLWSCWNRRHRLGTWHRLKCGKNKKGYLTAGLTLVNPRRKVQVRIHRLVLELFIGPCPDGMEACHNDGNRINNFAYNLRWDTHAENIRDSVRHGTHCRTGPRGSRNGSAKLKEDDILAIRQMIRNGMTKTEIASRFGVHRYQIYSIETGKTWSHI
jgi:hypothetical protein